MQNFTPLFIHFYFLQGLLIAGIGPPLVDLAYIFDVSIDTISIISSIRAVGYCLGAISATSFRWINRQLANGIILAITSVACAVLPHAPSVYVAYVFIFFYGIGGGLLDQTTTVWLMEMWYENPLPVMQLAQALYGAGNAIAPLIEQPFVTGDEDDEDSTNKTLTTPEERREKLTIPFTVFGVLLFTGVAVLFLLFFIRRYTPPPKEVLEKSKEGDTGINDTKLFERENSPKIFVIILASLCLAAGVTMEASFLNFSSTFSQKIELKVSAPDAATIQAALSAAYTIGRAGNFFVAMKLNPGQLLLLHYSIISLSLIALIFAGKSLVLLWIANVTIGYGFSAIVSANFAFIGNYLIVNDSVSGIMVAVAGALGAIIPYLIGLNIESVPESLIYINIGLIVLSVMLHTTIRLIVRLQRRKILKNKQYSAEL